MTNLADIGKASESRWSWAKYLFRSRRIVQDLLDDIERAKGLEETIREWVKKLESDLEAEKAKTGNLAAVTDALDEALKDAENARSLVLKTCAQRDALQERVDTLQANCDQNAKAQAELAAAQEWSRQVEDESAKARHAKHDADAHIVILEAELKDIKAKLAKARESNGYASEDVTELWRTIRDKDDAIHHLVRWIQTTHRTTPMPEPNTIKRLLFDAQQARRQ